MGVNEEVGVDGNGAKDLTPEEARKKREYFLAMTAQNTNLRENDSDEIDSADSTMATLILPGG